MGGNNRKHRSEPGMAIGRTPLVTSLRCVIALLTWARSSIGFSFSRWSEFSWGDRSWPRARQFKICCGGWAAGCGAIADRSACARDVCRRGSDAGGMLMMRYARRRCRLISGAGV